MSSSTQNQSLSALLFLYRHALEKEFGWLEDVVRAKTDKHVILLALVLRAVQAARQAARGAQCQKQTHRW